MGYTPLFDTMLSGTLYGRWPHTGVWACLLSRVSREGLIDETPQCLAGAIGISVDMLKQCIHDFMQPDPESRTTGNDGRRLELIDPERSWGWRVLNHQKYKEKARKKAYDETRTETGADAERKRAQREQKTDVPRSPDASREVPLSSHLISSPTPAPTPESEGDNVPRGTNNLDHNELVERIQPLYPKGTYRDSVRILAAKAISKRLDEGESSELLIEAAELYCDQQRALEKIGTQFVLSPAKFYGDDGDWRGPFNLPVATAKKRDPTANLTYRPTE